jgi:O-antigen/teichoic acid export membrane protein
VDLFLARHYLPKHDAGIYAAGNVVTKVAFWGPSFVATVAYPRLSEPDSRAAALRRGAVTICAFAVVATVAAAVGGSLVPVVVGQKYRAVAHLSWMFALQGAALAAVLFGVYAGLAVHRRALAALVWLVAAAETGVIALAAHRSVHQIITVVLVGSAVLVAAAAWEQRAAFVDR